MHVRVEFFGIPRSRAGRESIVVEGTNLGEVLASLRTALPEFADACLREDNTLRPEYLLNVNGTMFSKSLDRPLNQNDTLIVLSADVGG